MRTKASKKARNYSFHLRRKGNYRPLMETLESRLALATVFGVTSANALVQFDSATPGTISTTPITGLVAGDVVLGIDFRPATGQLFALSSGGRLYTLNQDTGAATLASTLAADPADLTNPFTLLDGVSFGVDFNPVPDRLRVVSNTGQNLRINVNNGLVITDDNLNPGTPSVGGSAYSNSFAGAMSTTLYGIDTAIDALVIQNPPNNGTLATVGTNLGVGDITTAVGFDIQAPVGGGNTAFAAMSTTGTSSDFYTINLTTGVATLVGGIGSAPTLLVGLAVAPETDLLVTKTDSPDPVVAGENITYTLTVTNNGPSDAQAVTLTDNLPANTTFAGFVSISQGIGIFQADVVTANFGTIASGTTATLSFVVNVGASVPDGTIISNTATASSTTTDPTPGNNSATSTTDVDAQADLSVTKTDSPDPVDAGTNLTYTITITNAGLSDAQGVSLSDAIPVGTTFVSAMQTSGPAFALTTPAVGGTGTFTATAATLAAGATATFTLVVNVNASALQGATVTNTTDVSSTTTDTDPTNNSDTETTSVEAQSDLSVTKEDSPDPVVAGENLTYTITVTSGGPSDAQNVSLSDAIPPNTTFVSATQTSGPAFTLATPPVGGTGTFTATAATLAAGATATFTLVVNVNANTPDGATLTNTAQIVSGTTDPNLANNSDTETTSVITEADLSVVKFDSPDPVEPGANLTYTIVLTNNGSSDAQGVTLTDAIPAGTTFVSFTAPAGFTTTTPPVGGTGTIIATNPTLAAGAAATFTLVVRVASATPSGTIVSNTATVTATTTDPNLANNSDTETSEVQAVLPECEVTTLNSPGNSGTAALRDDADNPGTGVLIVTGTSGNDVIIIEPRPSNSSQIRVKRNGQLIGIFNRSAVQHIVAFGLAGDDTIIVNASLSQRATLFGHQGNDQLFGARGADGLDGGLGNDRLFGGSGNDTICGGGGNDFLYGQVGNDLLGGDAGHDQIFGEAGRDFLLGNDGNDSLYGGAGNDRLFGQAGNDRLFGDSDNDIVVGGDGNDQLFGDGGRDLLIGGRGGDTLFGEADDDILVAGFTVHDNDEAALRAILAEWTSTSSYNTRVNNIRNGGGANGVFVLNSATVSNDALEDTLWGDGGLDWFLFGPGDKLKDKAAGERVN